MQFTPYIILERQNTTIDPLGFLQPLGVVKDAVFPQFTSLTRHPAYLGFLCFAFQFWERRGVSARDHDFLHKVRLLEVFWGLLHALHGQSVLNITKCTTLVAMERLTREAFDENPGNLFKRLNYGTYGHYVVPATTWRLVTSNRAGLTSSGSRLAAAWGERNGNRFEDLAKAWLDGGVSAHDESLCEAGKDFLLSAAPDRNECGILQETMADFADTFPVLAPLWRDPIPPFLRQHDPGDTYLLPVAVTEYPEQLALLFRRCLTFDLVAGIIRFVFDLEYLRLTDALPELAEKALTAVVQARLDVHRAAFQQLNAELAGPRWELPETLHGGASFADLTAAVVEHHVRHQHRKGASAYMENGRICLPDMVDGRHAGAVLEALQSGATARQPAAVDAAVLAGYGRNWYLGHLVLWRDYAEGRARS